jgi:hypothetical protein
MDEETIEKSPVRKWTQMTHEEQRQELTTIRQSRYFSLLPRRLQNMIKQII